MADKPISGVLKWGDDVWLEFGPGAPYALEGMQTEQPVTISLGSAESKPTGELVVTLKLRAVAP